MTALQTSAPGLATVIVLPARRAREAVSAVTVRVRQSREWTVVEVEGEMDVQVVALLGEMVGSRAEHVVFDLQRVSFMDASGVGLMLGIHSRALQRGGSVRLVSPSRSARRLLMMTDCHRWFSTFESIELAVATPPDNGPGSAA